MGKFLILTSSLLMAWLVLAWSHKDEGPKELISEVKVTKAPRSVPPKSATRTTSGITPQKNSNPPPQLKTPISGSSEPDVETPRSEEPSEKDTTEGSGFPGISVEARMIHEMDRLRDLNDTWLREKKQFYEESLHLNDEDIGELYRLYDVADAAIKEYIQKISDAQLDPTEKEYEAAIKDFVTTYEQEAYAVLGEEGFNKTRNFREDFNTKSYARFGTHVRQMGF
jgi:hypothetical protein